MPVPEQLRLRRVLLLYNPAAGRRRTPRLAVLAARGFGRLGVTAEVEATEGPGEAGRQARAAVDDGGFEAVFGFGGDGTLREVASGLLGSPLALGVLPGGTTNVVARALGIPLRPLAALEALAAGTTRELDVGLCGGQPFLMQASAGLDAAILAATSARLKRRLGRGAVVAAALAEWWRYSYPRIELRADGEALVATFVAVCNLPLYAGPFRLAPGARPDDGRLDLVTLATPGRAAALGFATALAVGRHVRRRDVRCQALRGEAELLASPGLRVQLDGDVLPLPLPVTVRLAAHRLRVLVPGSAA